MANLRRKLPPLTALTVFESVARHASFTKAAEELGVTQAAVSRQIHLLEQQLGYPLFRRLHRRIDPTDKGALLAASATSAFNQLAETIAELGRGDTEDELAIAATVAFSHFWLLPRISSFSKAHPTIKLRIVTQDNAVALDGGDVDLALRFGSGVWSDGQAEFLFHDEVFPICSPAYAEQIGEIASLDQITQYPLIVYDTADPTWTGWNEWLAAFSIAAPAKPSGMRCSYYTEAIYAALNGNGITLGWRRLVDDLIVQNRLMRLTEATIITRNAYFVVVPRRRERKRAADLFIDWLKTEIHALGPQAG